MKADVTLWGRNGGPAGSGIVMVDVCLNTDIVPLYTIAASDDGTLQAQIEFIIESQRAEQQNVIQSWKEWPPHQSKTLIAIFFC